MCHIATEGPFETRIPVSTYRLQFNHKFTFSDARDIVAYLDELGISDIYASPYFKANKGSLHGYDIVDPTGLNPEIGTEADYDEMVSALQDRGMGQLLDIVPNHMCIISEANIWWMDVLENGPSSLYADFFDIDWDPVKRELRNKVLLPFLSGPYGEVLERQDLSLVFEEGKFFVRYYEYKFPVNPKTSTSILGCRLEELARSLSEENEHFIELQSIITALNHLPAYIERKSNKINERYREKEVIKKRLWKLYQESPEIRSFIDGNVVLFNGRKGDPSSFDLLDDLLNKQPYRLAHWRVATDEINYRRFFDINQIAAVRMESLRVFNETHKLILRLVGEGKVTGLRVDHPDGLYNPSEYFRWLQRGCFLSMRNGSMREVEGDPAAAVDTGEPAAETEILKQYEEILQQHPQYKPFYIVGEKILTKGERMPEDWPIFSTTGYVFMNTLNGIFVDTAHAKAFDTIYSKFIGEKMSFADIVYEKKKLIMQVAMSSEVNTLGHYLNSISERNRHTRDFTLNSLTGAIIEVISFFPVYRTYINSYEVSETDCRYIEIAVAKAKRKNRAISEYIYNFLKDVLLLRFPEDFSESEKEEWLDFVTRFQQITGPVMAKGLEDTAFYVYHRLVSLNEVGGSPDRFGVPLETFHGQNIERLKFWPHALIASSTHDAKRCEDVRARINVLSELPDEWKACLIRWRKLNKKKKQSVEGKPVPDPNEEYLYYQTLLGAWPVEPLDESGYEQFRVRIKEYMLKALREGKVNSSWINMEGPYEEALMTFIDATMDNAPDNDFKRDLERFQKKISHYGMLNCLSQTLLKITSPGVPDFYQGTELWKFCLVDPDNRRPVDYRIRAALLKELKQAERERPLKDIARELLANKNDGRVKLFVTYKALNYRRDNRALFEKGDYTILDAGGKGAQSVCAFARTFEGKAALVIAPRFFTRLAPPGEPPVGPRVWNNTFVAVSFEAPGALFRNVFTGETVTSQGNDGTAVIALAEALAVFPLALLEKVE
ncbi:MAG: malto-oligosyltrehalose synthase [Nitrospirota bacterium]